jgi:hypothetical protein
LLKVVGDQVFNRDIAFGRHEGMKVFQVIGEIAVPLRVLGAIEEFVDNFGCVLKALAPGGILRHFRTPLR